MDNENTKLDNIAKVSSVVTGFLMVIVTVGFAIVAQCISQKSNEILIQQRKSQVLPILTVLNDLNYRDSTEVVVHLQNIGSGPANYVKVLIGINDASPRIIRELFTPLGTPHSLENSPGTQQEFLTLGHYTSRDWFKPNDVLEFYFQHDPYAQGKKPSETLFTLYISFFDIDGNQYWTITKTRIGGNSGVMTVILPGNTYWEDSLLSLSRQIKAYESITFENLTIRNKNGMFKSLKNPQDKIRERE